MKRYITFVFSLLVAFSSYSQSKYKDVYEIIKHQTDNEAYQTLQVFSQQRNNSHSASLYKMGIILERRIREYDPFLQATAVERAVYDAELYFGLARHNFNEKVARQDGSFFDEVQNDKSGKTPTFLEISEDIDNHLKAATKYKKQFLTNREYLYKAAGMYNECIVIFNDICRTNSKLKDLYFMVDEQLERQLQTLQTNFDSTLFFLDQLQKSLAEYPMRNYKFKYRLNPIVVYRMHGLIQANFLAPEIQLWDFSSWIKKFKEVRDSEVAYLYDNVTKLDELHAEYMQQLETKNDSGVPDNYRVSQYLLNKIQKYDNTSMASLLLSYQQLQINYAQQLASYQTDTNLLAFGYNYPLPNYFSKSIKDMNDADSMLNVFGKNINPEGIKKYSCVFEKKYKGEKGLKEYVNQQKKLNSDLFSQSISDYSSHILHSGERDTANKNVLVYNGDTIWAQVVAPENIWGNGYFVHSKAVNDNNETIIAGTYIGKRNERSGFVANIDTASNIVWMRMLKNGDANRNCLFASPINNDVAAILTTTSKAGVVRNFMILIDASGNVKQTTEVRIAAIPRKLMVDDINNTFIVAFGGKNVKMFTVEDYDMHICCLDAKFKTVWDKPLKFRGYFSNILKNNNVYYLYGAFEKIISLDNEEINLDGSAAIFQYSISADGNWLDGGHYEFKQSTYPVRVSKVDNVKAEVVLLLDDEPSEYQPETESAYLQLSFDGEELFSTIK